MMEQYSSVGCGEMLDTPMGTILISYLCGVFWRNVAKGLHRMYSGMFCFKEYRSNGLREVWST